MSRATRHIAILVTVTLCGCLAALGGWRFAKASAPVNGPFVLISIDALRADHLPVYGYESVKTPAIDALAANDVDGANTWFQKASTADPYWAKPLLRLGEAAMKKGDGASAARLLARAVEVDPTAPEAATAKTALESLKK